MDHLKSLNNAQSASSAIIGINGIPSGQRKLVKKIKNKELCLVAITPQMRVQILNGLSRCHYIRGSH